MTTIYNIDPQIRGLVTGGLIFCDTGYDNGNAISENGYVFVANLAVNANTRLTVPGGAGIGIPASTQQTINANNNKFVALISVVSGASVFCTIGAPGSTPTIAQPNGDHAFHSGIVHADGTQYCELLPSGVLYAKYVVSGQVMAFLNNGAAAVDISVSFYSIANT